MLPSSHPSASSFAQTALGCGKLEHSSRRPIQRFSHSAFWDQIEAASFSF